MNKIEKLIQEYCPDGVEYKELGEVSKISRGRVISKEYIRKNVGYYPVYSSQTENEGILGKINTYEYDGEYITWTTDGANAGSIFHRNGKFNITNVCGLLEINSISLNVKFLTYWLDLVAKLYVSEGMGNPKLMSNTMSKIQVPIPPLPVQQEIVNILDKFTQLEQELNAELETRRKQYDFYLNHLMGFEGSEVEWKTLGEVGEFIRGNGLQKKDFTETGVGCIHYGQIYTHYGISAVETKSFVSPELAFKLKKAKKGDLIIAATSENVEDVCKAVAWLGDDEIAISGDAFIFTHNQNSKYISYFFQSIFFNDQKVKLTTGTKVIRVSISNLEKIVIPIPPLSEQERIVSILDKFDSLVNDTTIGIPAEIEARRKQYAYYRNKLLTFEEYA